MLASRTVQATMDDRATAFSALLDRGLEAHYRLAAVILGDPIEAEDAVHDAAVIAWRGFAGLHDRDRFEAWFGRILVNGCRDRLRVRRRRPVIGTIPDTARSVAARGPLTTRAPRSRTATSSPEPSPGSTRITRSSSTLRYYADLTVPQIASPSRDRRGDREIPPAPRAPTPAHGRRSSEETQR